MCQAAILHWWLPNRQKALYTNRLLNYGNEQLKAFEGPNQSRPDSSASGSIQADAFWAVPINFTGMLAFNYPKAALPADFQAGVQSLDSRRRSDAQKRRQPESTFATHNHQKRVKQGANKTKGQCSKTADGRIQPQAPELSNKLQKRLATFLELVIAGPSLGEPAAIKLVCTHLKPTVQSDVKQTAF